MVANLLPTTACIRSFAHHQLVGDYSHGIVVHNERMILSAHYFRSHINGRSAGIRRVLLPKFLGDSEISDAYIAYTQLLTTFGIKHEVFRFDIPMNDALVVQVLEPGEHAGNEEASLLLIEPLALAYVVA